MKERFPFDPCRNARALLELLFDNGLVSEAILLTRRVDEAQAQAWRAETQEAPKSVLSL